MPPTARELLQRRAEQRRVDELRSALTGLRVGEVLSDEEVLGDWARTELAAIGRTGSEPDATLDDAESERLDDWLIDLESRADLGSRVCLGTSLEHLPWLDCEVISAGWVAEVWRHSGDPLRVLSGDRRRLLVVFEEEHATEAFLRADPAAAQA